MEKIKKLLVYLPKIKLIVSIIVTILGFITALVEIKENVDKLKGKTPDAKDC